MYLVIQLFYVDWLYLYIIDITLRKMKRSLLRSNSRSWFFSKASALSWKVPKAFRQ